MEFGENLAISGLVHSNAAVYKDCLDGEKTSQVVKRSHHLLSRHTISNLSFENTANRESTKCQFVVVAL